MITFFWSEEKIHLVVSANSANMNLLKNNDFNQNKKVNISIILLIANYFQQIYEAQPPVFFKQFYPVIDNILTFGSWISYTEMRIF